MVTNFCWFCVVLSTELIRWRRRLVGGLTSGFALHLVYFLSQIFCHIFICSTYKSGAFLWPIRYIYILKYFVQLFRYKYAIDEVG